MNKKTVSVYGYGRFGKFWADILADDFEVKVYSRRGLKRDEVSKKVTISTLEDIYDCDAIFYCVAISSFEKVLMDSKPYFKENTVFFDTCSVKVEPGKWMQKHLPGNAKIVATHPMFGPDSYSDVKDKLPMVMCNMGLEQHEFDAWTAYFSSKNMRVELMTTHQHDETVAYSQGITHYVGRVLADLKLKSTSINTLGYAKLLEIIEQTCNDSFQLFLDLQDYNPYTKKMRVDLHNSIERIYELLKTNGREK